MILDITMVGHKLLEAIENTYKKRYVGVLKVEKLEPIGFKVSLGHSDKPVVISAELDEDSFIKYFIQELRVSRLHEVEYFEGVRSPDEICPNKCYEARIIEKL